MKLFIFKHEFLKISAYLRTVFAAETHLAEGATERGKVTYAPSRSTNAECSEEGRGVKFSAIKNIY
jgi:hypothetical protein